ncbi:ATP-dependent Clp protease proteolytic subunit [Ruminococcus sp.]|uniref:ClpP family protease n=1 Tax=Ruminococcus sp. TaxID=41978 RepID=UPI002600E165|nr:ATP-dependent Clp protease proteolytic subunit [Ruminococcus sp.]
MSENHKHNTSDPKTNTDEQLDQAQLIEETGAVRTQNAKHLIHCLTVIGQVEGHNILPDDTKTTKYEHILPALVAIEQDRNVEGLLVVLNTMGGDVEAGLAIAEMISGMKTPTVSLVIGGGHSIGIPMAVSADISMIVPSASMTVHPVRTNGLVLGVPQTVVYFEKIQERITGFITRNSSIDPKTLEQMMMNTQELATDIGTVISGEEAVACGLIDRLGTLHDAIEALYHLIETREPRYPDALPPA